MRAMILAAGRGERLRPLTDETPKPLLKVGDKTLIEYHLQKLGKAGVQNVIINTAWLGQQIRDALGTGDKYNLSITFCDEGEQALETAGGIINALPLLGDDPFLVINSDIFTDYDFAKLIDKPLKAEAHLVLVPNPEHNNDGDFALENHLIHTEGNPKYTFSGIGVYSKAFFHEQPAGIARLAPIIRDKSKLDLVTGELYKGQWTDVGTVERLEELNRKNI